MLKKYNMKNMLEMLNMVKESGIIWVGVPQTKQRENGAEAMFDRYQQFVLHFLWCH